MQTSIFKVSGMTGPECVRSVVNAIQDLPCLGHVEVSLERAEASVEHTSMLSEDDIRQAIVDAGFEVE